MDTPSSAAKGTSLVALAPGDDLPAHLMKLLEDWHSIHPGKRPLASALNRKRTDSVNDSREFAVFSEDGSVYPMVQEIGISRPSNYIVFYLHIPDGDVTGMLVKPVTWGSRLVFYKKWLPNDELNSRPVAVRIMKMNNSFGRFPEEELWQRVTEKKVDVEYKLEDANAASASTKRRHEKNESVDSSDSDQYPIMALRRAKSAHLTPSNVNDQVKEDRSLRTSYTNDGLSISRSTNIIFPNLGLTPKSHLRDSLRPRSSLSGTAAPAKQPLVHTPTTGATAVSTNTSDSGVDMSTAAAAAKTTTTVPARIFSHTASLAIILKLKIPRTRTERHIHIEENDFDAEDLFKEARDYFRRHDGRMLGPPILECVIDGEPECRCIYNAKELRYYVDELRVRLHEKQEIVRVTVTHSS